MCYWDSLVGDWAEQLAMKHEIRPHASRDGANDYYHCFAVVVYALCAGDQPLSFRDVLHWYVGMSGEEGLLLQRLATFLVVGYFSSSWWLLLYIDLRSNLSYGLSCYSIKISTIGSIMGRFWGWYVMAES